jgi:hypothetical protein
MRSMLTPTCSIVGEGQFLMRYLGIPIYYGRFIIAEGKIVEDIL